MADPVTLGLIGGGMAANLIGGAQANKAMRDAQAKQDAIMAQLRAEIDSVALPEQKELILQKYQSAGVLTPDMEEVVRLEDPSISKMSIDRTGRDAQMKALLGMQGIASEGGLTAEDRANVMALQEEVGRANKGNREAILQNMQSRGMAGSGLELAQQLGGQQETAMQSAKQGAELAKLAQMRKLEAIMQSGAMGKDLNYMDTKEAMDRAAAQDAVNRFNASNTQDVLSRNVGARNAAQAANLGASQQLSNANIDLGNQATQYNLQAGQRNFENQMAKQGAKMGIGTAQANNAMQGGIARGQTAAGVGAGIGQGFNALAGYLATGNKTPAKKSAAEDQGLDPSQTSGSNGQGTNYFNQKMKSKYTS